MANLKDLVEARKNLQANQTSLRRVLVYGGPKSGKTFLAGTVAQVPSIKRVWWFDLENGSLTLTNPELGLTTEDMNKVELLVIPDTKLLPIASETILKVLSNRQGITICEEHGKVNCVECKASNRLTAIPPIQSLNAEDCIVIDSLSQLGDSALEVGTRMNPNTSNAYAKYGDQGQILSNIMSLIQQLRTNIICITHVTVHEAEDTKRETVIPLCGTRNFSLKVAKYFSTVLYMSVEMKKFKSGSSPTYKINTVAGDRSGIRVEDLDVVNMTSLWGES